MNPRERKFVLALAVIATTSAIHIGRDVATEYSRRKREERRVYVSKEEIEMLTPIKTPPVLVIKGEVEGRDFEIVMRGFTNYFRKETWGAAQGQRRFMGGQKAGGYAVEIRTKDFSGEWKKGWRGTGGGGGGGGCEEYQDDLPAGRDLWNSRGFVGPRFEYESHSRVRNQPDHSLEWKEEYEGRIRKGEISIPKKIVWSESGRDFSSRWSHKPREFKIRSFKFQEEPLVEWFEGRVKEYFPPQAISRISNAAPKSVVGLTNDK